MLSYCLKCKKNTESKNPRGRMMLSTNCAVCGNKESRFIKEQEPKGLLSMIGKI